MASDPSQDPSASPSKSQPQPPTPQRVPSSAFKARLAAFESGAASNSSSAKYDAASALAQKGVLAADMGNLRSRFDKEGDKPLVVKGSFGLGATAAAPGSASKDKGVSLGGGRAAAPTQSPTVVLPDKSPLDRLTGSTSGKRPTSSRSDSTHSTASGTAASNISTGSSLLPDRVASLSNNPNISSASSDDASMGGLRTPMSSVSLSSLQVESGSLAGDSSTDRGSVAAAEERSEPSATTPGLEDVKTPEASPLGANPISGSLETVLQRNSNDRDDSVEVEDSAAQLAKKHAQEASNETVSEGAEVKPPQDAVEKAAAELAKYSLEEPSKPAQPVLTTQPSVDIVAQEDTSIESDTRDGLSPFDASDRPVSPAKARSRPGSYVSSLKRSSTANSIKSTASQPEADLADIGLDNIDNETSDKLGITQSGAPPAISAGPESPPADVTDKEKAQHVADSMAPPVKVSSGAEASDAPIASASGPVPEVVSHPQASQDDISHPRDDDPDVPQAADESAEVDEDDMPLVKCSDCAAKVSLMQLGEHICSVSPSSKSNKRRSLDMPEDVLVSESLASPTQSPSAKHRAQPSETSTMSRVDVPSDTLDSLIDDYGNESSSSANRESPFGVYADEID